MPAPPFTALAAVYDAIMQDVPYDAWVDFALRGAAARGWRGGRVVDLGCGTGGATAALVRRGLDVVGVDVSPSMLAVARAKLSVPLVCADMRTVPLEGRFALALSVFDSVNNLLDDDDLPTLARHVLGLLEADGGWVFDVNTTVGLTSLWDGEVAEGWAGEVHYRWTHDWDPHSRRATVDAWCETPTGSFSELHHERPYDPPDLIRALTAAGFRRVDAVVYPDGQAAGPDDPRVWVFASAGRP